MNPMSDLLGALLAAILAAISGGIEAAEPPAKPAAEAPPVPGPSEPEDDEPEGGDSTEMDCDNPEVTCWGEEDNGKPSTDAPRPETDPEGDGWAGEVDPETNPLGPYQ